MLSLLAVFIFNLILLLALFKASEFIFSLKTKLKYRKSYIYKTVTAFAVLFLLSVVATFGSAKLIANTIPPQRVDASELVAANLDSTDCKKLLDTIYLTKNKIANIDDHRNIEATSPLFTIKLEYQKGAEKLRESASIYEKLDLPEKSKVYSQNIAQQMQAKADYFDQRTQITETKAGTKQILKLLKKMDRVTYDRQIIVEGIERQCSLY